MRGGITNTVVPALCLILAGLRKAGPPGGSAHDHGWAGSELSACGQTLHGRWPHGIAAHLGRHHRSHARPGNTRASSQPRSVFIRFRKLRNTPCAHPRTDIPAARSRPPGLMAFLETRIIHPCGYPRRRNADGPKTCRQPVFRAGHSRRHAVRGYASTAAKHRAHADRRTRQPRRQSRNAHPEPGNSRIHTRFTLIRNPANDISHSCRSAAPGGNVYA